MPRSFMLPSAAVTPSRPTPAPPHLPAYPGTTSSRVPYDYSHAVHQAAFLQSLLPPGTVIPPGFPFPGVPVDAREAWRADSRGNTPVASLTPPSSPENCLPDDARTRKYNCPVTCNIAVKPSV